MTPTGEPIGVESVAAQLVYWVNTRKMNLDEAWRRVVEVNGPLIEGEKRTILQAYATSQARMSRAAVLSGQQLLSEALEEGAHVQPTTEVQVLLTWTNPRTGEVENASVVIEAQWGQPVNDVFFQAVEALKDTSPVPPEIEPGDVSWEIISGMLGPTYR